MKRLLKGLSILLAGLVASTVYAANTSPEGYWKTIDDVTGQTKSIIQIWKTSNQVLVGKVVKIFPADGSGDQTKLCTACEGAAHNQPVVGMVILSGLRVTPTQWDDGKILDPENGKTYSCSLRVADNGKTLNLHGYVGIPILGRSQTWQRVDLLSA